MAEVSPLGQPSTGNHRVDDRPAVWLVTMERLVEDEIGKRRE